jgi:hypothetical protein
MRTDGSTLTSRGPWPAILRRAVGPTLAIAAIIFLFLPLTRTYDLDVFLRAGRAALHGLQVYPPPGSPTVYAGGSFVYPYVAVLPFVPLAALGAGVSTVLFFALSVGAVLLMCSLGSEADPWRRVLVLCTSFTITGLQLGALSPLLFAGVVLLWRLRDRPVAFGLVAAPIVVAKLFLAPLLLWLVLARRWRAFAWASCATLTLLAAGFAFGPLGPAPYLRILSQLGAHEARAGFGLIGALINLGSTPALADAAAVVIASALFLAAYFHHRRRHDERVLFCAGIVAALLLSPVLWSHYLILLTATLLAFDAPRRWFVVFALASWAIAPPHGVRLDTDLIEGVTSSGIWLAVAASLLIFWLRPSNDKLARPRGLPRLVLGRQADLDRRPGG